MTVRNLLSLDAVSNHNHEESNRNAGPVRTLKRKAPKHTEEEPE